MTVLENVFIPIPELVSLGSKTLAPPLPPPQPVDRPRMWRERGREGGATTREDTRKLPVTMTGKRAEGVHHPAGGFFGFDYSRYHNRREECENPAHAVQSTLPQKVLTYYAICPDDCLGVRSCDGAVTSRRSSTSAAIFMGDAGMGKLLFHGNLVTVPVTFR